MSETVMTAVVRILMGVSVAVACSSSASAAIVCDGPYQIIRGQPHTTPYCEDRYLAQVARSYGFKVTDSQIRNNHSIKSDVCRAIGSDLRIANICRSYRDPPRGAAATVGNERARVSSVQ
jgi:hypothetical protein